ncbi:spexin prohormone 1 [Lepisosteus oculatus]|uniref:Spexin hormone n=1 Tax=Lepisosteus oculatus TaxID=7918 RepID=W5NE76_LEPOC|nr:PREDICTED: spexin [Lepisosteus oculatus]
MKGLKTLTAYALAVLVLATFIAHSWSAPKGFQRRNWTPQAMLYLKGAQGRRFVSEDRKEGDVYDALHLETRSQDSSPLSLPEVAALLLSFIQQAKEEANENAEQMNFQDLPTWNREFF